MNGASCCFRSGNKRLAKWKTRLRRTIVHQLVRERIQPDTSPLYLRDGQAIAESIDPARVIFIKRMLIAPPEREQEQLPEMQLEPDAERKPPRNFAQPIRMPNPGIL